MLGSVPLAGKPYDVTQLEGMDFVFLTLALVYLSAVVALMCLDGPHTDRQHRRTRRTDKAAVLPAPTPAMGRWRVDVQVASFHLVAGERDHDGGLRLRVLGDAESSTAWSNRTREEFGACEYPTDVGFAVPLGDVDHVLAAIEEVHASSEHHDWWTDPSTGPESTLASYFDTELVDGWVRVYGPMIISGHGAPWRAARAVEIEYRYLPWLPGALVAARANATTVCPGCELALPCQQCRGSGDRCDSIAAREQDPLCQDCGGTGWCSRCQIEGVAASRAWADTVRG